MEKLFYDNEQYIIKQNLNIADINYILAVKQNDNNKYIVLNLRSSGTSEQYEKITITSDYLFALSELTVRIQDAINKCKNIREESNYKISSEDIDLISDNIDINNKVIVIKLNALKPELRYAQQQVHLCIGGLGVNTYFYGHSIICINLFTGSICKFNRSDVLGILKHDKLPDWIRNKISMIHSEFNV